MDSTSTVRSHSLPPTAESARTALAGSASSSLDSNGEEPDKQRAGLPTGGLPSAGLPSAGLPSAGLADCQISGGNRQGTCERRALTSDGLPAEIAQLYGLISSEMAADEQRFHQELQSPYESIVPLLRHGTQLGGKRLRPAMLLLSGLLCGEVAADHVVLGTVIEMVHTATLIHDDVLDDAETRRHVPTINSKWNNHTSILLGDYLFAQGFRLASTLGSSETCQLLGEASRLICEGEMRQILSRNLMDLDETTYLEMIQGKTAELCRVACQLGAKFSKGTDAQVAAVAEYGNAIGIAFQIADDYLDLWGSDGRVGKTLGTDLEQGKLTLPLIRLLSQASDADAKRITRLLASPSERRRDKILPWLNRSDSRAYTLQVARSYHQRAVESLDVFQESGAKLALIAIADFAVNRRF